jgi:arginine utilization regulatory protein
VDAVGLDTDGALRALEAARGGTLYVRDVPALASAAQEALAPRCAGGETRLIGSSQVDPAQRDDHAGLIEPLWELLRRGPLRVPSLRHRREDLGPLATSIVRRHAHALGKRVEGLTHGALEAIEAYDWPGNVRELDALLSVAVAKAGGALLARGDLPEWLAQHQHRGEHPKSA